MIKRFSLLSALLFSSFALQAAPATTPAEPSAPAAQESICASLSADEQKFASALGERHKEAFCSKFTPEQRDEAMKLSGKPSPSGAAYTPTSSVEKVALDNGIPLTIIEPSKPANGCHVN